MVRLVPLSCLRRLPVAQKFGIPSRTFRAYASAGSIDALFKPLDTFERRHVGPDAAEVNKMLSKLGYRTMDEFVQDAVPQKIRISSKTVDDTSIPPYSESELLKRARDLAKANKPVRSYIGMGYWNAVVPPVILRNVRSYRYSFRAFAYPITRSWKTRRGIPNTLLTSQRSPKVNGLCLDTTRKQPKYHYRSFGIPRELSDNGHFPHRHAHCQCFPTR